MEIFPSESTFVAKNFSTANFISGDTGAILDFQSFFFPKIVDFQ